MESWTLRSHDLVEDRLAISYSDISVPRHPHFRMAYISWIFTSIFAAGFFDRLTSVRSKIEIEIVTLGYVPPVAYSSLSFIAPAMDFAVEEIRNLYGRKFNFSHVYLYDEMAPNCRSMEFAADYLLSRWFYTKASRPNQTAFISPSKSILSCHNRSDAA